MIANGEIYVADTGNHRIQVFDSSGNFSRSWGGLGIGFGTFDQPTGIALRPDGNVIVTDFSSSNVQPVQEFTNVGAFVRAIGIRGTGNGELLSPGGVIYVPNATIIVDTQNNRVQSFLD